MELCLLRTEANQHEEGEISGRFGFECKLTIVPGIFARPKVIELCAFSDRVLVHRLYLHVAKIIALWVVGAGW